MRSHESEPTESKLEATDRRPKRCSPCHTFFSGCYNYLTGNTFPNLPYHKNTIALKTNMNFGQQFTHQILSMADLATKNASGMCWTSAKPATILLITKPEHLRVIFSAEDKEVTRGIALSGFEEFFPHNLISMKADKQHRQQWIKQRHIFNRAILDKSSLKNLMPDMKAIIDQHTAALRDKKGYVDIDSFSVCLAMNIASQMLVGTDHLEEKTTKIVSTELRKHIASASDFRFLFFAILKSFIKQKFNIEIPTPIDIRRKTLQETIKKYIIFPHSEKIANSREFTNVFKKLVDLEQQLMNNETPLEIDPSILENPVFLAHASFIFLAGQETTSLLINYLCHNLAQLPDLVTELRAEAEKFGPIETWEDLEKLELLNWTIKETLRLDPPIPVIARTISSPLQLKNPDVTLPKNTVIFVSPYVTQRLEEVAGPYPLSFNPYRWRDNSALEKSIGYFPFTTGRRICPGMGFALLEAKLAALQLILNFDFNLLSKREKRVFASSLRTEEPIEIKFTKRGY